MDLADEQNLLRRTKKVLKWYLVYHIVVDLLFVTWLYSDTSIFSRDSTFRSRELSFYEEQPLLLAKDLITVPVDIIFSPYIILFY